MSREGRDLSRQGRLPMVTEDEELEGEALVCPIVGLETFRTRDLRVVVIMREEEEEE